MEMTFSRRLDLFGPEIFAALNDKKIALEAQGRTLYNLSVGTPDFPPAPHIKQALIDAAARDESWKYTLRDIPELLAAVGSYYQRRFGVAGITPDRVMSFSGSQDGIGHLGLALLNEGDTVLLPDPCYPVFMTGMRLGGGVPYFYPLTRENGFLPNVRAIPQDVAQKAKVMLVSLPANPVGSIGTPELYAEIVAFCKKYNILLVHDNAYSDIIFDGAHGGSVFNTPGAEEVAVEFFSLSKSFNVTGARISFLVGRPDVAGLFFGFLHQIVEQSAATVLQQIENQFEPFMSFVIGVGDMAPLRRMPAEFDHAVDFPARLACRRHAVYGFIVVVIHDDDPVEPFEIRLPQRPCPVCQFISALRRSTPHAPVRQIPCMAGIGSCRIRLDAIRNPVAPHHRAEDLLCGGRTADVAEADE